MQELGPRSSWMPEAATLGTQQALGCMLVFGQACIAETGKPGLEQETHLPMAWSLPCNAASAEPLTIGMSSPANLQSRQGGGQAWRQNMLLHGSCGNILPAVILWYAVEIRIIQNLRSPSMQDKLETSATLVWAAAKGRLRQKAAHL